MQSGVAIVPHLLLLLACLEPKVLLQISIPTCLSVLIRLPGMDARLLP